MTVRPAESDVLDDAFAAFVADVRAVVPSPPHERTARRHLAAMRAVTKEPKRSTDRAGRRRSAGVVRPLFRLGAVTAGAVAAFAGATSALAAVGVELPDPVRAPFEAVGVELPNQPENESPAAPPSRDAEPGAPGVDERATRGSDTGRGRSGDRGEQGRGRAAERRAENGGKARGREGTQPGKDGTRGRSETRRRDDTAPNRSSSAPNQKRTKPERRPKQRDNAPALGQAKPKRTQPDHPKPTGPKPREPRSSGRRKDLPLTPPATTTDPSPRNPRRDR